MTPQDEVSENHSSPSIRGKSFGVHGNLSRPKEAPPLAHLRLGKYPREATLREKYLTPETSSLKGGTILERALRTVDDRFGKEC